MSRVDALSIERYQFDRTSDYAHYPRIVFGASWLWKWLRSSGCGSYRENATYTNRAGAYLGLGQFQDAIEDVWSVSQAASSSKTKQN